MEVIRAIRISAVKWMCPRQQIAALLLWRLGESVTVLESDRGRSRLARWRTADRSGVDAAGQSATQVAGDVEICLPWRLVDVARRRSASSRRLQVRVDVDFFRKKLANEKFVANAPPRCWKRPASCLKPRRSWPIWSGAWRSWRG